MPKFEVVSHEYDQETNIDTFVFNPGNMEALVQVIEEDKGPKVLLGIRGLTFEYGGIGEITWSTCSNPAISEVALEYYDARKQQG